MDKASEQENTNAVAKSKPLGLYGWAAVVLPALVLRIAYGVFMQGEPVFEKYLALAVDILENGVREPFSSCPVYTFWIAGLIKVFGFSPNLFRWVQLGLGLGSVCLTAHITSRIFGRAAGIAAGLLYGCCGAVLVYEGDLVTAPLVVFLNLLSLAFIIRGREKQEVKYWVAAGLFLGASCGIRPNAILLIPLIGGWIMLCKSGLKRRSVQTLAFVLASVAAIAPITIINYQKSGEFIPVTWIGGPVFYSSNNHSACGLGYSPPASLPALENDYVRSGSGKVPVEHRIFKYLAERAAGKKLGYNEASKMYFSDGFKALKRRDTGRLSFFISFKAFYLFNDFEYLDTSSLVMANQVIEQKLPFLYGFGVLVVLGLAGMVMFSRESMQNYGPVKLFILPYLITAVVLYVNGRYRVPLSPILAMTAGLGVSESIRLCRISPKRVLMFVFSAAITCPVIYKSDPTIKWQREVKQPAFLHSMNGMAALRRKDVDTAIAELEKSVRLDPLDNPETHTNLALAYRMAGRNKEAEVEARLGSNRWTVKELGELKIKEGPDVRLYAMAMGSALWREGQKKEAEESFHIAARLYPVDPTPVFNLAMIEMAKEKPNYESALEKLRAAIDMGLKYELASTVARRNIIKCLTATGRIMEVEAERKQLEWEAGLRWSGSGGH